MKNDRQFERPLSVYVAVDGAIRISTVREASDYVAHLSPQARARHHWRLAKRIIEAYENTDWPAGLAAVELTMLAGLAADGIVAWHGPIQAECWAGWDACDVSNISNAPIEREDDSMLGVVRHEAPTRIGPLEWPRLPATGI